jgi:pantoate kinase
LIIIRSSAFAPGHITCFFNICNEPQVAIQHRGSIGAGICLSLGAKSTVKLEVRTEREPNLMLELYINGKRRGEADARTTFTAIQNLLADTNPAVKPARIIVETELQLPEAQGFGMSGAGTLSTALALATTLQLADNKPIQHAKLYVSAILSAHSAEIAMQTGLGDVAAQATGGIVIRETAGIPPYSKLRQLTYSQELADKLDTVVLCVIGAPLKTSSILTEHAKRQRINKYGADAMQKLLTEDLSFTHMIKLSYEFAKNTGLLSEELADALRSIQNYGIGSMAMLGNSIFAIPHNAACYPQLVDTLKSYGKIYCCKIDKYGLRPYI